MLDSKMEEHTRNNDVMDSSEYIERMNEKYKLKTSLRKKKIDNIINQKRFSKRTNFFTEIPNFTINDEIIKLLDDALQVVDNYNPSSKKAETQRNDKHLVNTLVNFLLKTDNEEQYRKLLEVFICWAFLENFILEMLTSGNNITIILNKSFVKFASNKDIFEKSIILTNHFLLAQIDILQDSLLSQIFNKFVDTIKTNSYYLDYSLRTRNALVWGCYLILHNFNFNPPNISEVKLLLINSCIEEIQKNLQEYISTDNGSNNCVKVMMMVLESIINKEKQNPDDQLPLGLFKLDHLWKLGRLLIAIPERYMTFKMLIDNPMKYETSELHKSSLKLLTDIFRQNVDNVKVIVGKIGEDKLNNFIRQCFNYYKSNYRYCDTFNYFFSFIDALTKEHNDSVIQLFENQTENNLLQFDLFAAKDIEDEQIRICYNFYINFPFILCQKFYHNNYDIEILINGYKSENLIEKENSLTLTKAMIESYNSQGLVPLFKAKLHKKCGIDYIEKIINNSNYGTNIYNMANEILGFLNTVQDIDYNDNSTGNNENNSLDIEKDSDMELE